jgi:hypothetical protein
MEFLEEKSNVGWGCGGRGGDAGGEKSILLRCTWDHVFGPCSKRVLVAELLVHVLVLVSKLIKLAVMVVMPVMVINAWLINFYFYNQYSLMHNTILSTTARRVQVSHALQYIASFFFMLKFNTFNRQICLKKCLKNDSRNS